MDEYGLPSLSVTVCEGWCGCVGVSVRVHVRVRVFVRVRVHVHVGVYVCGGVCVWMSMVPLVPLCDGV